MLYSKQGPNRRGLGKLDTPPQAPSVFEGERARHASKTSYLQGFVPELRFALAIITIPFLPMSIQAIFKVLASPIFVSPGPGPDRSPPVEIDRATHFDPWDGGPGPRAHYPESLNEILAGLSHWGLGGVGTRRGSQGSNLGKS